MNISKDKALELMAGQIEQSCRVKKNFSQGLLENLWTLAQRTAKALRTGQKVLLMGNGGSAADAQHIAAEFVGRYRLQRRGLPALALTTNASVLTAISNDFSFDNCFARQLDAFGQPGDVVIAISTSGRSPNVIRGVEAARARSCYVAAFTGQTGGDLAALVDLLLAVPSEDTQRIQEAHSLLGHLYCDLVERLVAAD